MLYEHEKIFPFVTQYPQRLVFDSSPHVVRLSEGIKKRTKHILKNRFHLSKRGKVPEKLVQLPGQKMSALTVNSYAEHMRR